MVSAMYENGGNVTHRCLDGHPQLAVYPFESQLGTRLVNDHLTSLFPVKYRWPVFALEARVEDDYAAIIDEECRVRARTPHVSKFRHRPFDFADADRAAIYARYVRELGRSRAHNVEAFFRGTFDAWKDYRRTGREAVYVGYSPIVVVDADRILADLPGARLVHVVRNPWSAYADTKKRPVPLPLEVYVLCWVLNQYHALLARERYPDRVDILRFEDVAADPLSVLGGLCDRMGVERAPSLAVPSWNGEPLDEVYPWGTIRTPSPGVNRATADELSQDERDAIRRRAAPYLEVFDYASFLRG
jgi:hypothetical protein